MENIVISELKRRYRKREKSVCGQHIFRCITGSLHPMIDTTRNFRWDIDYLFDEMHHHLTPLPSPPEPIDKTKVYAVIYDGLCLEEKEIATDPILSTCRIHTDLVIKGKHKFPFHRFYLNQRWFEVNSIGTGLNLGDYFSEEYEAKLIAMNERFKTSFLKTEYAQ